MSYCFQLGGIEVFSYKINIRVRVKDTEFCTDKHKKGVRDLTLQHFTQSSSPRRPLPMISLAYCGNEGGGFGNLRVYKNLRIINLESVAEVKTLR